MDESENRVTPTTPAQRQKGLEFPKVYPGRPGVDGLFPSRMSINSDDKTGHGGGAPSPAMCKFILRPKMSWVITSARQQADGQRRETRYCKPSRFMEVRCWGELLEEERLEPVRGGYGQPEQWCRCRRIWQDRYFPARTGLPWNQPAAGNTRTSTFGKGYNRICIMAHPSLTVLAPVAQREIRDLARGIYSEGSNPGLLQRGRHTGSGTSNSERETVESPSGTGGKDYEVTVVF